MYFSKYLVFSFTRDLIASKHYLHLNSSVFQPKSKIMWLKSKRQIITLLWCSWSLCRWPSLPHWKFRITLFYRQLVREMMRSYSVRSVLLISVVAGWSPAVPELFKGLYLWKLNRWELNKWRGSSAPLCLFMQTETIGAHLLKHSLYKTALQRRATLTGGQTVETVYIFFSRGCWCSFYQ